MKQDWSAIKEILERREETDYDIRVCRAFFGAGWEVHPEAGNRFQRNFTYEDGSQHRDGISKKDAENLTRAIEIEVHK